MAYLGFVIPQESSHQSPTLTKAAFREVTILSNHIDKCKIPAGTPPCIA